MRVIIFLLAVMLAALLNIVFVGVHYSADRIVPVETVKQRVRTAIASDNIVPMEYPWKTVGYASPLNAIGLNHRADCIMSLMAMHRDANPVLNAVNPSYLRTAREDQLCDVVKALADDNIAGIPLQKRSNHFFWHGAKPVTQLLLTKFDYYQIYQMIRQLSYLAWALLLAMILLRSFYAGVAFVPVAGLAILGSGLPYNGGIVFALPYLSALVLTLGYLLVQSRNPERLVPEIFYLVVAGSVQAFFMQLDGSIILLSALLIFNIYFLDRAGRSAGSRLGRVLGLMLVFYLSFVASLLIKQGFAGVFVGFESAWASLQAGLSSLFSPAVNPATLATLIDQYAFSIMGHHGLARYVQYAGLIAWLAAGVLALIFSLARRRGRPLVDMLVFGFIGLVVLARFILVQTGSPEGELFASRYWFVAIAFGMSATTWLVATYRYREDAEQERMAGNAIEADDFVEVAERTSRKRVQIAIPGETPRESEPESANLPGVESKKEPGSAVTRATPAPRPQSAEPATPRAETKKASSASAKGDKALEEILSGSVPDSGLSNPGARTEVTKEPSRLTVEIPESLDES